MSREALLRFISKDERLCQTRQIGDITVRAMYYPYQLLVAQELGGRAPEGRLVDSLEGKYKGQVYFKLSFSKNHQEVIRQLGGFDRYSEMVQVFSFEMGKHINITDNQSDTTKIEDYTFLQDFGTSDANELLLAFKEAELKSNTIHLNVAEFGLDIGAMTFNFDRKDLNNVPKLTY
jgi:hypothetical protein